MRAVLHRFLIALCATLLPVASPAQQGGLSAPRTASDEAASRVELTGRIVSMLSELATNAQALSDPDLRLYCQLEAASLLWPREPDRSRQIFSDAFDGLVLGVYQTAEERAAAAKQLSTLLAHVARRDPALAERFARRLTNFFQHDAGPQQPGGRADILLNAAMEMLPGDPARAAGFAAIALGDGVTPALMRFLVVLRGVDSGRADALFEAAITAALRDPNLRLADVNTLSFYLVANGGTSLEGIPVRPVRVLLATSLQLIIRTPLDSTDASSAYFLGRQLSGLFAKYLPDQAPELEARIALLSQSEGFRRADIEARARAADAASPDVMRAHGAATDVEQDDFAAAHEKAAEIEDDTLRSRVYAQAALRLLKLGRLDDADREIARVPDPARRASLLIQLAGVAHASGDLARAVESLNDAEREAKRVARPITRVQTLFSIASAFVSVDSLRAFETMQTAVESANKAARTDDHAGPQGTLPPGSLNFNATFAQLARIDFDGAWLLARQFDGRAPRLLAELAVCRGGLAGSDDDDDDDEEL